MRRNRNLEGRDFGHEFRNVGAEIGIRRTVRYKNKEKWQKLRICIIKYKV
jgi:hypothetical protein